MSESICLHGVDPDEQARLSRLNDWLNTSSLRELAARPGERVVDFGSGLGQLTRSVARAVAPGSAVVGVDYDAAIGALRIWSRRPDAALWYAVCWCEGVRPE